MSDVIERFMRYVQVDSQSDPDNEATDPLNAFPARDGAGLGR